MYTVCRCPMDTVTAEKAGPLHGVGKCHVLVGGQTLSVGLSKAVFVDAEYVCDALL